MRIVMRNLCKETENFTYSLFSSTIRSTDYGAITVYGISIEDDNHRSEVKDISDDYDFVCMLFDMIVEEELYPEHLMDVVEDYLSDNNITIGIKDRLVA